MSDNKELTNAELLRSIISNDSIIFETDQISSAMKDFKKAQERYVQSCVNDLEQINKALWASNGHARLIKNKDGLVQMEVGFSGENAQNLLLDFDKPDFLNSVFNNNQLSINKKLFNLTQKEGKDGKFIPAVELIDTNIARIKELAKVTQESSKYGINDISRYLKKIQAIDKDVRENFAALGVNNNYANARRKEIGGFDIFRGNGKLSLQRVMYNAVKGQQADYSHIFQQLTEKYNAEIKAYQKSATTSKYKVSLTRAQSEFQNEVNNILAAIATARGFNEQSKDVDPKAIQQLMDKTKLLKMFNKNAQSELASVINAMTRIGIGYGASAEDSFSDRKVLTTKAKDVLPFGGLVVGENRSWMQGFDISNRAAQVWDKKLQKWIKNPRNYSLGKGPVITSNIQNKIFKKEGRQNKIDLSYGDNYRTLAVEENDLNNAILAVTKKYIGKKNKTGKDNAVIKILEQMKLPGVREDGMILNENIAADLAREVGKDATISDLDIDSVLNGKNKKITLERFNKFIEKYKDSGARRDFISAGGNEDSYKRAMAAALLSGKLKDHDLLNLSMVKKDNNGNNHLRMGLYEDGHSAHRYLYGENGRVMSSFVGGNLGGLSKYQHDASDLAFKEIVSAITGMTLEEAEKMKVVGFTGAQTNIKQRKMGEEFGLVLNDIFEQVSSSGKSKEFIELIKNSGIDDSIKKTLRTNKDGRFTYNISNKANNYLQGGEKWHEFLGAIINAAKSTLGNDAVLPFSVDEKGIKLEKNWYFKAGALNAGDQDPYGAANEKGGEWFSANQDTIESISRTLGRNSKVATTIAEVINKNKKISAEDYTKTKTRINNDVETVNIANLSGKPIKSLEEDKKNIIISMSELQEQNKKYQVKMDNLSKDGVSSIYNNKGQIDEEAFKASPFGYLMSKIADESDIAKTEMSEMNVIIDLGEEYEKQFKERYAIFTGNKGSHYNAGEAKKNLTKLSKNAEDYVENERKYLDSYDAESGKIFQKFVSGFDGGSSYSGYMKNSYEADALNYFYGNGTAYTDKALKTKLGHSASLSSISPNMPNFGKEDSTTALKWAQQGNIIVNPKTLAGMLAYRDGDDQKKKDSYQKSLNNLYHGFFGEDIKDISNKEAINKIVRGTNLNYNNRKKLKEDELFRRGKLLNMMFGRFPFIYGENAHATSVLTSNNVQKESIYGMMGLHRMMSGDFDADKISTHLLNFDLDMLDPEIQKDVELWKAKTQENAKWTEAFLNIEKKDGNLVSGDYSPIKGNDNYLYQLGDIKGFGKKELDIVAEVTSRVNKSRLGTFSNFSHSFRTGSYLAGLDRARDGEHKLDASSLRTDILTELFSSIEQDIISAKKIRNKDTGEIDEESAQAYLTKVDKLWETMQNAETFSTKEGMKGFLSQLQDIGIIGDTSKGESIFKAAKRLGAFVPLLQQYDEKTVLDVLGNPQDEQTVNKIRTFLSYKNDRKATADFVAQNGALFGLDGSGKVWDYLEKIAIDQDALIGDTLKNNNIVSNGKRIFGTGITDLRLNNDAFKGYKNITSDNLANVIAQGMLAATYKEKQKAREEFAKLETENAQKMLEQSLGGFDKNIISNVTGGALGVGADPAVLSRTLLKAREKDKGAKISGYGKPVTTLIQELFPNSFGPSDRRFGKALGLLNVNNLGVNDDNAFDFVGADTDTKLAELRKTNYLGYGSKVDLDAAIKANRFSQLGTARHSMAQIMAMAQSSMGKGGKVTSFQQAIDYIMGDGENKGNKKLKQRITEDDGFGSSLFKNVERYRQLLALSSGSDQKSLIKAETEWQIAEERALAYKDLINKDNTELRGVEQDILGTFNGRAYRGSIDAIRLSKEKKNGKSNGSEGFNSFIDILDLKPGSFNIKQGLQAQMYKYMLEQARDYADSNGINNYKDAKGNAEFMSRFGGSISKELFNDLMEKDKDGKWKNRLRTGIINSETGTTSYTQEKLGGSFINMLLGAVAKATDNGGIGNNIKDLNLDFTKPLADILSTNQINQIASGMYEGKDSISNQSVEEGRLLSTYLELEKIKTKSNKLSLEELMTNKDLSAEIEKQNKLREEQESIQRDLEKSGVSLSNEELKFLKEMSEEQGKAQRKQDSKNAVRYYKQTANSVFQAEKQTKDLQLQYENYKKKGVSPAILDEFGLAVEESRAAEKDIKDRAEDQKKRLISEYGLEEKDFAEIELAMARKTKIMDAARSARAKQGAGFLGIDSYTTQMINRIMNGGAIMAGMRLIKKGMTDLVNKAKQLDSAMTNLRIVTGDSAEDARTMISGYAKLGKDLGASTLEVTNAASEWLRQGYNVAEVNDLVRSSMYLSKLGMIDSATATKDLTSAMKGFKLEASESLSVVDKLTALDIKAATTAGDIAEGLSQFANLASLNGVSIDQASAYVATIADVTQQSGNTVGQAMKTIMSRYGNVKATAYNELNLGNDTGETDEKLNDVEKVLNKLGVSMRDTNLEFKDFDDVLDEIADKWGTLDNVSKKAIANSFAGIRQQESFLTLMENYDNYKDLLDVSENSAGTATEKYASYKESYASAKNELTASLEEIANNSGIINALTDLTKGLTLTTEWLGKGFKFLPALVTNLANLRAMTGKSMFTKLGERMVGDFNPVVIGLKKTGNSLATKFQKIFHIQQKTVEQQHQNVQAETQNVETETQNTQTETQNTQVDTQNTQVDQATTATDVATATTDANAANVQVQASQTQSEAANQQQQAAAQQSTGGASGVGGKTSGLKMSKLTAGLSIANMAINTLVGSISQFATAATTHKYDGETVESSKQAQKAGGGISAIFSLIPFVGSIIGPIVGEQVAKSVDKERDQANAQTKRANENISNLNSFSSNIDNLGEHEFGSVESKEATEEFMKDIFSTDNDETRALLEQYLGDDIYTVLTKIQDNTEDSAEAYRQLKIAELKAERAQIGNKYASQLYKSQTQTNESYTDLQGYSGVEAGTVWGGIGIGAAGAAAGVGGGAALAGAALAVGLVNAWNPVGWAAMIVGGIAGLGVGIAAAVEWGKADSEKNRQEYARNNVWSTMTNVEKLNDVKETLKKAEADGNSELVEKCNSLISSLNNQISLTNQMLNEMNNISLEAGFISARITNSSGDDSYLSDMSVSQLKNMGIDDILLAYGRGIEENGGLTNKNIWADEDHTTLSDAGYEYLFGKLKQQGDEEVNSVLSGGSYTLEEALNLRAQRGEEKWIMDILEAFSTSLKLSPEALYSAKELYGTLTYAETLLSTSELTEKIGSYTDLLGSITSGAGETSKWMETIIEQFPDLIAYMGDTSTLFSKIGEKLGQLSNVYMQSQYNDIVGNEGFYSTIKTDVYSKLSSDAKDQLDGLNITKVSDIIAWTQQQYGSDGTLSDIGQEVVSALQDVFNEYGVEVTSDILKDYYDQLIDFKSKSLDNEINNLNEQKEALQNINSQREYENKLIEAKLKLENASKEKKRVYRAGVGWVYEADQASIGAAQKELESVQNQKTVSELEAQIEELQAQKDELNGIYDAENYETLQKLYESFTNENQNSTTANGFLEAIKNGISGISTDLSELMTGDVEAKKTEKESALSKAKDAWDALQSGPSSGSQYNTNLSNYYSAMSDAKKAGVTESDVSDWGSAETATQGSVGAWDMINGKKEEDLASNAELKFVLPDTGTTGQQYVGRSSSDPQYDSTILGYIFDDLKKKKGFIWGKDAQVKFGPNNWDARYLPTDDDKDFLSYIGRLQETTGLTDAVFSGYKGKNESVYLHNGALYKITNDSGNKNYANGLEIKKSSEPVVFAEPVEAAIGSLGIGGGVGGYTGALINELGTEAIITPQGTLTALPSKTGVVPADITKNLWELGEVAPSLLRFMTERLIPDTLGRVALSGGTDESLTINSLEMKVDADSSFDVDKFVDSIKARVALTRNSGR